MKRYYPEKILILDKPEITGSPVTRNVLAAVSGMGIPVKYVDERGAAEEAGRVTAADDPFREGKKTLLITGNNGEFLKKCPGTNDYICCDYYIIDFAQNCPMDCTYCILQAYLNNPLMIVYANIDALFSELDARIPVNPEKPYRVGTGEFTDSMALEHLTKYSSFIMDYFEKRPEALIEFKSKTDHAETFLQRPAPPNVLLSWSMNSPEIVRSEEHKTASLAERLESARKCADAGYNITLHFDPIIDHDDFDANMAETVRMIFEYLPASKIKYISLGCFRFIPRLKDIIAARFPNSKIIYNEFIKGYDKKSRYFRFKRERLFKKMVELIEKHDARRLVKIYFCMESPEMWGSVFGKAPAGDEDLGKCLYDCCFCK